jgi:hypothetical protein
LGGSGCTTEIRSGNRSPVAEFPTALERDSLRHRQRVEKAEATEAAAAGSDGGT